MQLASGEALPANRIDPSARKKRGPQDDRVVAKPYPFLIRSSAGSRSLPEDVDDDGGMNRDRRARADHMHYGSPIAGVLNGGDAISA